MIVYATLVRLCPYIRYSPDPSVSDLVRPSIPRCCQSLFFNVGYCHPLSTFYLCCYCALLNFSQGLLDYNKDLPQQSPIVFFVENPIKATLRSLSSKKQSRRSTIAPSNPCHSPFLHMCLRVNPPFPLTSNQQYSTCYFRNSCPGSD
jgi:hypothetical protein